MYRKLNYIILLLSLIFISCQNGNNPLGMDDGNSDGDASKARIYVIGDSISLGINAEVVDTNNYGTQDFYTGLNGYAQMLESRFDMVNASVHSSDTTDWREDGIAYDNLTNILSKAPEHVILELGANDVLGFVGADLDQIGLAINTLFGNLQAIIDDLRNANPNVKIYLMNFYDLADTISPSINDDFVANAANEELIMQLKIILFGSIVDDSVIVALMGQPGFSFAMGLIKLRYDVLVTNNPDNVYLVDIYETFKGHAYLGTKDYVNPDFFDIHPNTDGHRAIRDTFISVFDAANN